MVVQELELHEWFLVYQLDQIKKTAHHLPTYVKLDISEYVKEYRLRNEKVPVTALLIKIIGVWAAANPDANKMLFRTFFGLRFLKGDEVRINFPIGIEHGDKTVVSAIIIRNPQLKSVSEIHAEIKAAKSKSLSSYPITNWVHTHSNHFLNRFLLKSLHTLVNAFPKFYWKKGGGCISISSLSNLAQPEFSFSTISFGPTGFTFFFKDTETVDGRTYLNLSIAVDHNVFSGMELVGLINKLVMQPMVADEERTHVITQDIHTQST